MSAHGGGHEEGVGEAARSKYYGVGQQITDFGLKSSKNAEFYEILWIADHKSFRQPNFTIFWKIMKFSFAKNFQVHL